MRMPPAFLTKAKASSLIFLIIFLASCSPQQQPVAEIEIMVKADGEELQISVPIGSNAVKALELASMPLGLLDRTEPDAFTPLSNGDTVSVIRVSEEFETEQSLVGFGRRILQNESLPVGEKRLIQAGINGLEEITFRLVYEEGNLISRTQVNSQIVDVAIDEIVMLGIEAPSSSLNITGRLAFLSAGNAWLMEENTGLRRLLVASGDLDGRIFSISPDGNWLLYTRKAISPDSINALWAVNLNQGNDIEIDLETHNIVHYADWKPSEKATITFSTVEPSLNPPGWQANNDLQSVQINLEDKSALRLTLLSSRNDTTFSWWGSDYAWSPDGDYLAYANPESVGLVNIVTDQLNTALDLTVFQTESDWAWMPTVSWNPDSSQLYTVQHSEQLGLENQELSPFFDVVSIDPFDRRKVIIAQNAGMFANPATSPRFETIEGDLSYKVAYLQALNPSQSDITEYQLVVSDANGENGVALFPLGLPNGLVPQRIIWSPLPQDADASLSIAIIFENNLWIVDVANGNAKQITGDGLVNSVAWGQ